MRTVVLVEDHAPVRSLHAAALRARGWHVLERPNARELARTLREAPADVVVLDWTLPGKSGLATLRAIKHDPLLRHLRVIMLTAHHTAEERRRALAEGAESLLEKPLPPDGLCVALEHPPSLAAQSGEL